MLPLLPHRLLLRGDDVLPHGQLGLRLGDVRGDPAEAGSLQHLLSVRGEGRLAAADPVVVEAPLLHHPLPQHAVGGEVLRHVAVPELVLVVQQLVVPRLPFQGQRPDPPFEADRLQLPDSVLGHGLPRPDPRIERRLVGGGVDIQLSLNLDPPREFPVPLLGDVAVAVFGSSNGNK